MRFLVGMFAFAGAAGGVGALGAAVTQGSVEDAFFDGAMVGLAAVAVWAIYAVLVLGVLWVMGLGPDEVVSGAGRRRSGRHVGSPEMSGWRRRGHDPLVPVSLIAVFAVLGVVFAGVSLWTWHAEEPFRGDMATAHAEVLAWDHGWLGLGDRELVVWFVDAGTAVTARVRAEDVVEEAVPAPGGYLTVEYPPDAPHQARPVGTAETRAEDVRLAVWAAGVSSLLALVSAFGRFIGRRGPQPGGAPAAAT
nr:hypothetical protein DA06_19175 [Georgenia sp. SUBG003]